MYQKFLLAILPFLMGLTPLFSESLLTTKEAGGVVLFTPPPGWVMADSALLPPSVRVMVVGKGERIVPPSMNLTTQPYTGTLKQYLKIIKNKNDAQGYAWKDLGNIRTQAGQANLSQVDTKSEWGEIRLMHVTLLKNGWIYILTASALKEEFSKYYKQFFAAMRSLRVCTDLFEMVTNPQHRTELKAAIQKLKENAQKYLNQKQEQSPSLSFNEVKKSTFEDVDFQNNVWKPFKEMLDQKFVEQGPEWQKLMLQQVEQEAFIQNTL